MRRALWTVIVALGMTAPLCGWASEGHAVELQKAKVDVRDVESLQRGARTFMNYCQGCHSLKYMRYQRVAKDIGIVNKEGEVDKELVAKNLIFTNAKISDLILSAMHPQEASHWLDMAPPDLTLVARVRGNDWLYTYLKSFYLDPNRRFGSNNLVFPNVAMPNILEGLQGQQVLKDGKLVAATSGQMSSEEFDGTVHDLVNFLAYVAEPNQLDRLRLGIKVLLYLAVLLGLTYWLKREFWKDVG